MKIKLHLFLTVLIVNFSLNAQKISGYVFSKTSNKPIDRVAIITNNKTGTVSDKFGNYNLQLKNATKITFSSLGYQSLTLTINDLIN
ncbi:carboxypeptidase-like regulatory domain-containing protein [Polaribacter marinaquae]|uniref:Carboxypeptidase-like regulatory domain-containing protein n=1 Tax=Polaribacter marinaquae TaxID=1642819 RepID=A0ABZ2TT62_9FLAO